MEAASDRICTALNERHAAGMLLIAWHFAQRKDTILAQMIQVDRFGPCLRNPVLPPPEEGESEEEEKSKEVMVEGPYDTLLAQYR